MELDRTRLRKRVGRIERLAQEVKAIVSYPLNQHTTGISVTTTIKGEKYRETLPTLRKTEAALRRIKRMA